MKGSICDRAALVEALFDGRLGPWERMSTERHLKSCTSCAGLLRDLTSLREMLRSSSTPVSPLDHQRARLALLSETARPSAAKRRPVGLLIAALMTLPLAVWASASVLMPLRVRDVTRVPAAASEAATPGSRAGQNRTAASSTALPVASSPQADDEFIPPRRLARRARGAFDGKPTPSASARGVSHASEDFAEALKALSRGDFNASASQLDGFVRVYPGDPRVEDATYLLAIALERAGRPSDAKAAARRYLATYPNGAHRAQAGRIAGD